MARVTSYDLPPPPPPPPGATPARTPAPEDQGPPPRWGLLDIIGAFLVAQIASALGFVVYAAAKDVALVDVDTGSISIQDAALLQVPLWLGLLGMPLLSAHFRGNGARRDFGLWTTLRDAPIGLAIGIACQFVLVPLVTLPVMWLADASQEELERPARELSDKATDGLGVFLLVLVVVVGAPLAEEVFYRGMLQRAMARKLPIWPTMIITSLLFAASHGQALQFPALAAFGLVLSYLAHRTGRLGRSIWAHVGFNATTVFLLVVLG